VAFEALHTMDAKMKGQQGYMALKLDMSKAYDRVEWEFLEGIMRKLGFADRWVNMLMKCIKSVSYSILINGQPHGRIFPSQGIRQGDPLSPYLFILCAEGLSHLLDKAERERTITGLPMVRGRIRISHLFFADDSLLFCKANVEEWARIQEILGLYEQASGQKLNREKTFIFFSRNTKQETKDFIISISGVSSLANYEKYLGLPPLVGRSKVSTFSGIQGRIWERINGWTEKFLTQAGKEVLLKAVIQAIPTYTMSVFQLPKKLCQDITSMMSRFWWGHKDNQGRMAWMSWKKMGKGKEKGGLGFRDLEFFNLAMLAKQGWRLIRNPESLVARIMKAKYYLNSNFLEAKIGRNPSYAWRSIWNSKKLLKEGLIWRVGDGTQIKIWEDPWIPQPRAHPARSPINILDSQATVSELLDVDTNWWNMALVKDIFDEEEARMICGLSVCPRRGSDILAWEHTKNGVFTVRSAYHLAMERAEEREASYSEYQVSRRMWKRIWEMKGSRVVKFFMWKACNNILPTKEKLFKREVVPDPLCPICMLAPESLSHILWTCPSAQDVWVECKGRLQKCVCNDGEFMDILLQVGQGLDEEERHLMVTVARLIWLRRNKLVFEGVFQGPKSIVRVAREQVEAFNEATRRHCTHRPSNTVQEEVVWKKPPLGTLKFNWDAAVDKEGGRIGMGVIARDSVGEVVVMNSVPMDFVQDPSLVEALAARQAVELSLAMGLENCIFEGDALEVIKAINQEEPCRGVISQIVNDIKTLLL
jgi:hypothetical protein